MKQDNTTLVRTPQSQPRSLRLHLWLAVALAVVFLAQPVIVQAGSFGIFYPPKLKITPTNDSVAISWPNVPSYTNLALETSADLSASNGWAPVDAAPDFGNRVTVTVQPTNTQQFFRLKGQPVYLVPLFQYAIFYNGLLEFSACPTMTISGPVHCNTNIYVGAGGSATLTFNGPVTCAGTISAPTNNGANWGDPSDFNSGWRTVFNDNPPFVTNTPVLPLLTGTNDPHVLIDMPPVGESPMSDLGQLRLFNQAGLVLLVSNTTVTTIIWTTMFPTFPIPAADPSPYTNVYSTNLSVLSANLPFLSLTNIFYDGRERTTNLTTQINVGLYASWISTNAQIVGSGTIIGKYPSGSGSFPNILYVADNRSVSANQLAVVRLTNGIAPPANGGQGFTVATPNPVYIWGNYNQTNPSYLGTTNTSSGTVPCAVLCDALTILSSNWSDRNSLTNVFSGSSPAWNASPSVTVNVAIMAGIVPSTGSDSTQFSGGVQNLPRLLENWTNSVLWLNASLVNLYHSTRATNLFFNPGVYYQPPTRKFNFNLNFTDPAQVPPGTPCIFTSFVPY